MQAQHEALIRAAEDWAGVHRMFTWGWQRCVPSRPGAHRTKCRAQQAHLDDVLQAGHTVHDHVALHWHAARKAAGQTWKMDCRMGTIERPSRLMAARMSCGVTCTACMQVHTPSQ